MNEAAVTWIDVVNGDVVERLELGFHGGFMRCLSRLSPLSAMPALGLHAR